jgi:gamma-glutamyltranspeptidase/glutathione hydrolase
MSACAAVAAGHPLTAEAGARVLREGGNAVDAAVAAVLTSFVTESPLTGLGAGGFMLVHSADVDVLVDFFVEMPGRGVERTSELVPVEILFDGTPQIFNIGAASCGVPGTAAGLAAALERFGSAPLDELAMPAARLARDGVEVNEQQGYLHELLTPVLTTYPEARRLYAPEGSVLRPGDIFRFPDLGDALERYAAEGPAAVYDGETALAISSSILERGGTLTAADLAAYEAIAREPVRAAFRGREILSNPPPSAGGILIVFALAVLERVGSVALADIVGAMAEAQAARTAEFHRGLYEPGFAESLLGEEGIAAAARRVAAGSRPAPGVDGLADRLGSTTHISVLDAAGNGASVTCSNGTGSGIVVPGTGVHVNNMLGEEDLNPLGFHRLETAKRLPSMMAPSVVLREGEIEMVLGSGGSNRIRSAILQAIIRLVVDEDWAQDAVSAPRLHFEADAVQAEPGIDEAALRRLEARGYEVARWARRNWFFGGVHTVARDPDTGAVGGGGDPRRGGAVALA